MQKILIVFAFVFALVPSSATSQSAEAIIRLINGGSQDNFRFQAQKLSDGNIRVVVGAPSIAMERQVIIGPGQSYDVTQNKRNFFVTGSVTHDATNNVLRFNGNLVIGGVAEVQFYGSPVLVLP